MVELDVVLADVAARWPSYVSILVIAALIGYVTQWLAIEMMFRPVEFVGIRPFLGWQGIVPANAARMAAIATDVLVRNLVSPREVFARLNPEQIAKEIEQPLLEAVEEITHEVMEQHQPQLWEALPPGVKEMMLRRVQAQAPRAIASIMRQVAEDIEQVLDIDHMVTTNLVRDKALLIRLVRDVGKTELRFVVNSGLYLGFVLGFVPMVLWSLTGNGLVIVLAGLAVGAITNWFALKMIFLPRERTRFGIVSWQGVFHKRRDRVTADYATLIATEMLTVDNIIEGILTGPRADRLFEIVQREIRRTVDEQTGIVKPFVVAAVGGKGFAELKRTVAHKAIERVPHVGRHAEDYVVGALDVRNTIVERMSRLSPVAYEGLLRPAFRQDEWKLVAVGGVLGGLVGILQAALM